MNTYRNYERVNGFTLIELLVVMGIIAVLSAISLFALQGARGSGRDAKRKADLQQIASGLELYHSDCRFYPNDASVNSPGSSLQGVAPCNPTNTNTYIQSIPDDPNTNLDYIYQGLSCTGGTNCTQFRIWVALETQPTPTLAASGDCPSGGVPSNCGGSTNCNYCIHNP